MPIDIYDLSKRVGCFRFGLSSNYIAVEEATSEYNKFMMRLNKSYIKANDEASLEITGISIFIGLVVDNRIKHCQENIKDMLNPSRVSLSYTFVKQKEAETLMSIFVNLESLCLDIGFRDLFFYKELADD